MRNQTNEFFYCCGLETPQSYLLMNGAERKAMPYLPERGKAQLGEGAPPGVEDTAVVTNGGIEIFTSGAPLELDDVESLIRNEGTQLLYLLTRARSNAFQIRALESRLQPENARLPVGPLWGKARLRAYLNGIGARR